MKRKTQPPDLSAEELIAPCGLNCAVCWAHLRTRNSCPGCRADDARKPKTRFRCKIKNCQAGLGNRNALPSCAGCAALPCEPLSHLDQRYRARYCTSPIANLQAIGTRGMRRFLHEEAARWTCSNCGARLCMHKPNCLVCYKPWPHA